MLVYSATTRLDGPTELVYRGRQDGALDLERPSSSGHEMRVVRVDPSGFTERSESSVMGAKLLMERVISSTGSRK